MMGSRSVGVFFAGCALLGAALLQSADSASGQGQRQVYFVPLGPGASAATRDLADHFRQSYKLITSVLPELPLSDPRLQDAARFQVIAEELVGYLGKKHPKLSWEPGAVVIGVTAQDMYSRSSGAGFVFTYYEGDRFGVLSTARMDPAWSADPANARLLRNRTRKAAMRVVGSLYYGYRETPDRRSVMFGPLVSVNELDRLREDY